MKFRYLDGLRGVAAIVVVFNHLAFMFMPFAINGGGEHGQFAALIHNTPLYLLVDGDLAVCIFFVLSGIVLSAAFFRTGDYGRVAASAVKRYFRLAIPTLGSVLLAYGLLKGGLMYNQAAGTLSKSPWWVNFWQFSANLGDALWQGLYGVFFTDFNAYNPVLWTMKIEFFGSFLVFITLALFGRLRNRWIAYLVLFALLWRTYYAAFLIGVVICDYLFNSRKRLAVVLSRGWWIPLLVVSLVVGSYPITTMAGTWLYDGWYVSPLRMHIAAATGIIIAIMASGWLQRVLTMRLPIFLGRISYPVYLLHFLILGSYTSYLYVSLADRYGHHVAAAITVLPTLALTLTAGYLYARYIDEPAIRWSGWLYRRVFLPGAKPVVADETTASLAGAADAEPSGRAAKAV